MKKVIVTGGSGFIGSNLIQLLLKKKYFVINIDKFSYSANPYNIKDFNPNQQEKLRKKLFSKKMMNPVITNTELFRIDRETSKKETERADGEKLIHKIGVGGIILDMFGTHLHDKSKMVKHAVSTESIDFLTKLLSFKDSTAHT